MVIESGPQTANDLVFTRPLIVLNTILKDLRMGLNACGPFRVLQSNLELKHKLLVLV